MWKKLALVLAFLLVVIVATLGYFFVHGMYAKGTDGRREIQLSSAQRDLVLKEMRTLLKAVNGIIDAVAKGDMPRAAEAASSAGMRMAEDVDPALIMKLPLDFKQLGMGTHAQFDDLAAEIHKGASQGEILKHLATITERCVKCHEGNAIAITQ